MICMGCKAAGTLNEKGMWYLEQGRTDDAQAVFIKSEQLHDDCTERGCFCHHVTRQRLVNP